MSSKSNILQDKKILSYLGAACVRELEMQFWNVREDYWDFMNELDRGQDISCQVDNLWNLSVNQIDMEVIVDYLKRLVDQDKSITKPIPTHYMNETWLKGVLKRENSEENLKKFRHRVRESLIEILEHLESLEDLSNSTEDDEDYETDYENDEKCEKMNEKIALG